VDRTVADPMIGRLLDGRYRVGARIARGGMATVYEATDLRLDRVVALKIMHAGLGDDHDFVDRFVREARSAARLSHPNVVAVFDQGDDDGTLFLAMEHVAGRTLRDVVRDQAPLPPAKALALLDPVLSALGAAHQAGLIHRDVKPENVLLADDGQVLVADFGLARAVSAETQHSTAGVLIGTVSYLSPELLIDGCADARSDVYAAGVVLYEMLTGRKPHEAASPIQVAYKHVHEDVPPPSRLVHGLPPYVDALVARATARDRDLRPADAGVLLRQVRRVRVALDHGVLDDPELTSDLAPTVPVQRLGDDPDDIDYVREDPVDVPTILTPAQAARRRPGGRTDDTSVIDGRRTPAAAPPPTRPDRRSARRRSRRGPALLVLVLLLAVAAGVGGWWLGAGRYTSTPGVLDLPARTAAAKLHAAGLGFEVAGRTYSETVPVGSVVSTDPAGGEHVTRNGTVRAVLSRGPERHRVPSLGTMTLDQAQAALQDARLGFGAASYAFSDTVPRGVVVRSSPRPGTSLKRQAAVDLVVSKGPRPVTVPDVTGEDAETATTALRRRHFRVQRTEANSDTVAQGDVVSQAPDTGRLLPGRTVRLVVSKGPVLVDVPEVRRMRSGEAESTLEAAGFSVRTERVQYYLGLDIVVKQDPGAGERAPRGGTVTIYVV
jgi:beta-lactam-binding protein with PASTA domain/serine/threonine protein kinase